MSEHSTITAELLERRDAGREQTGSASKLVKDAARAWNSSRATVVALMSAPFLVAMCGVVTALMGKETYKWFTGEDGVAETLQVVLYVVAFGLSLLVLQQRIRQGNRMIVFLYAGLACGFLFMIGEEISWGQRMFGWESPETFKAVNKQEETNLHNIHGVGSTFKWMQLLVGAYGALLPLAVFLAARTSLVSRYRHIIELLVPHYTLVPYFSLLFVWRIYRNLFAAPERYYFAISEFNEVLELVLAMAFVLFLVFQLRRARMQAAEGA